MDATVEPATTDDQVRAAARLFRQMLDECAGSYAADEPLGRMLRGVRERVWFFAEPGGEPHAILNRKR